MQQAVDPMKNSPIYLDSHSTTPMDPRVFKAMYPYFMDNFGNASSYDHPMGYEAHVAVEKSRTRIAGAIHADAKEIIFTSGATESDNLALMGVMSNRRKQGNHLVTCVTEHSAVINTAKHMEKLGYKVTYMPVNEYGEIDLKMLEESITDQTVLVSIMAANNEIGTIADIAKIGEIAHDHGALFHTDAAQAAGHVPIDVNGMNIDLMSISSHKIYGPKGVGALYVSRMLPMVDIDPIIYGGGQEKDIRPGTLNVPGIVGFAEAVEISVDAMGEENIRFRKWTEQMLSKFSEIGAKLNGHPVKRLAHNLNLRFEGVDGKAIINTVSKKVGISAGSACTTQAVEPSHVLLALGLTEEQAHSSIRIGCGRFNTDQEIMSSIEIITACVKLLRRMSGDAR